MVMAQTEYAGPFNAYSNDYLLNVYGQGPARVRAAVSGLANEELSVFPFPDKWSVKEIAFHLTESEIFGSIRFRQALTQTNPVFPCYDQNIWTKRLKYQQRDLYELDDALDLFTLLRKTNGKLLASLEKDQWKFKGTHPEKGEMTMRQLLELYADHAERHIDQILARRRLFGRSLDLPALLSKRL